MTLKRKIAKLEDVDEAQRGFYTKAKDGDGFVLETEEDPRLADLPKLDEFRENNRKMKAELDKWTALGLTPEQAAEQVKAARKKADDDVNAKLTAKQLEEKFQKQLDEQKAADDAEKRTLREKLEQLEVIGPIRQKLLEAGLIASEAEDFLEKPSFRKRFKRSDDGKLQFLDEQGDPILGMTVEKFAAETRKLYPRWFEPNRPGGAGTKTNDQPAKGDVAKIAADDQDAINENIDKIAAGEVEVAVGE
jgi:hypothetical protein